MQTVETNCSSELSRMLFQRDTRHTQTFKPASTLSSVSETSVHYLNDQSAINVVVQPAHQPSTSKGALSCLHTQDQQEVGLSSQGVHPQMEMLQNASPSASQRLESLRRQQTDNKLEKLKERIRKQREHLEEAADKKESVGSLEKPVGGGDRTCVPSSTSVASAHVRKVITAPPAPVYKGFSTSETRIHAPDTRINQEEEFIALRRDVYRDLTRQLTGDSTRPKARCRERLKGKKPVRSVRKVHKTACVSDSDSKPSSITTSKWREGQKLVKMILGSPEQSQHKSSPKTGDRVARTGCLESPSNAFPNNQNQGKRTEDGKTAAVQLSADIQGILDSLELDTPPGKRTEKLPRRHVTLRETAKEYNWTGVRHSAGPTKPSSAEAEKPELAKRKRHYDSAEVREYISRQQVERRKRQTEERRRQQEEAERRNQRLQELYRKQKEGLSKPVAATTTTTVAPDVGSTHRYLLDTYTNLLPEQSQVEAEVLLSPSTSTHKQRPLYQPSNESDKENKHQNRPQSASSSDPSVPENEPSALSNVMGLPARSSWVRYDGLCSSPRGGVSVPLESAPIQIYPQWMGAEGNHSAPGATCLHPPALASTSTNMASKMSRLEVLKSTATSLSNRIENEARKLLQTCKESQMSVSEVDAALPNQWARVDSASIGIVTKLDHPAKNVQKLRCTSLTTYDATLPGVGSLYAFREAQGSSRVADAAKDTAATSHFADSLSTKRKESKTGQDEEQIMFHYSQYGSNVTSVSERASSQKSAKPSLSVVDGGRGSSPLYQTPVFSSGTEKCRFASTVSQDLDASTAAWKELTKGSPYSVINIFTKNLPSNSKGQSHEVLSKGRSQRTSPASYTGHAEGPHENSISLSSHSSSQPLGRDPNRHCNNSSNAASKHGSSPQDDLKSQKSGIQSFSPAHSPGASSCSEGSVDDTLVNDQGDDWSEAKLPGSLRSSKECSEGSFAHSYNKDLNTDGTSGAPSVNSMHSLLLDLSQQRAAVCTPSASAGSNPPAASKATSPPVSGHSAVESFYPGLAHPSTSDLPLPDREGHASPFLSNHGAEPVVKTGGALHSAPSALQQRMTAELMYLDSIEESIRQLGDVERVRGVSLAQQEVLSLAHVLKSQQQAHEQALQRLKVKSEQEAFESHMQLEHLHQGEMQVSLSNSGGHSASGGPLSSSLSSFEQRKGGDVRNTMDRSPGLEEAYLAADHSTPSHSMPSLQDDKDSISVATEYSLKFDESMTEDEIEERSFRSLLPSESHRRGTLERKQNRHEESEEEPAHDPAISLDASQMLQQDNSIPFSSGQNSFSRFTMEMVRQYMKEEEVRAQHQSSLLQLRQRALKEKTRAELAWLEHQKRRLRDKGEDDKMPPIRKKQRVLILKMQQEQAEIKRLQEANKAARKERQLLLKQQEEIERMCTTTLKLRERLKTACHLDSPSFETMEEPALSQMTVTEANSRSTSPLSVSGSETSSIMQRLKKMHSHMDEKFLTKREQQLKQRRSYAEELLQWKHRLDFEEREIRRMERQAMAAWHDDVPEAAQQKDAVEQEVLTQPVMYSGSSDLPSTQKPAECSESSQNQLSNQSVDTSFSQDSEISQRILSSSVRTMSSLSPEVNSDQISSVKQATSDQSSIESRISALKEELRKRKSVVNQLKKEQKKRHKERLKTQEASLLKQLESYNDFIKKTTSELSKGQENTVMTKPERKPATEQMGRKPTNQRPEGSNNLEETEQTDRTVSDFQVNSAIEISYGSYRSDVVHKESLSEEDPPTVTATPVLGSPDKSEGPKDLVSPEPHHSYSSLNALSATQSVSENLVSRKSVEGETLKNEHSHTHPSDDLSDVLLNLECSAEPEDHSKDLTELSHRENGQNDASKLMLEYDDSDLVRPDEPLSLPEFQLKDKQVPSSSADGYNDDFESFAESTHVTFGKEVTASTQDEQKPSYHQSVANYSENEIGEEFTSKSKSVSEIHSEHLLDLSNEKAQFLDEDGGEDLNSSESAELLSSNSQVFSAVDKMASFSIGDRVLVRKLQQGILRFKGQTNFAKGFWAGVELDDSEGSNDGTYDGVVYFECKPAHGVFVPPSDVSHLQGLCNVHSDTTDDENSSFDDTLGKEPLFDSSNDQLPQQSHVDDSQKADKLLFTGDKGRLDQTDGPCELQNKQTRLEEDLVSPVLNPADIVFECSQENNKCSVISTESKAINLDLATDEQNCHISIGRSDLKRQVQEGENSAHLEKDLISTKLSPDETDDQNVDVSHSFDRVNFGTVADQLFKNFVSETVQQYQQIQKAKCQKIQDANSQSGGSGHSAHTRLPSPDVNIERFPLFDEEQEEVTSPELNKRQESPVLDASGQQELVKRLAELEFSRELLDALGDEPDWFDEDFGLSSRKEKRQNHHHLWQDDGITGTVGSVPVQQAKTPPRPDLPLQTSAIPEKPVMVVPYGVSEMEKLVCAATQEIWDSCRLGMGKPLDVLVKPQASVSFLGGDTMSDDQATYCKQSYKQAVFDLSWEVMKDIFAKDHNSEQPQWIKPQRTRSSYLHGNKSTEDLQTVQSFLTEEVLRLYGLKTEQNQQTDWQKMLKFGRKKRDRVDHILVQELHEEESQWVNYDEDELYVKMQLADGIFDALLKDTEDVLTQIQERRSIRSMSS
ncbi:hypothetical protein ACEWY4_014337 [Coilia grayii]|uniref:CAP-Gly domain-containing protein n=1 Tax=Coilia grayii TaxID=363190 RepID=A0ABD1JRZ9_9TELE